MKSFKLTHKQIVAIKGRGPFSRDRRGNMQYQIYRGQLKLRKGKVEITSVHHMVQKLLLGKNVYDHFLPKQEESWLVAVLAGDKEHMYHPYTALREACYTYLVRVPDGTKSRDEISWMRLDAHIRGMRWIADAFRGYITHEELIDLRPYVKALHTELTMHIRY